MGLSCSLGGGVLGRTLPAAGEFIQRGSRYEGERIYRRRQPGDGCVSGRAGQCDYAVQRSRHGALGPSFRQCLQIERASCRERSVSVRVDLGGRSISKKKKQINNATLIQIIKNNYNI